MHTTVAIPGNLLAAAKREARRRGLTLGRLIETALQRELAARGRAAARPVLPVLSGRGGLRPGVDATSNRALLELVDDGRPTERLR